MAGHFCTTGNPNKIPGDILVRGSVGCDPIGGGFGFGSVAIPITASIMYAF